MCGRGRDGAGRVIQSQVSAQPVWSSLVNSIFSQDRTGQGYAANSERQNQDLNPGPLAPIKNSFSQRKIAHGLYITSPSLNL